MLREPGLLAYLRVQEHPDVLVSSKYLYLLSRNEICLESSGEARTTQNPDIGANRAYCGQKPEGIFLGFGTFVQGINDNKQRLVC